MWLAEIAVAEAWGQFGYTEKQERLTLEAMTRALVKTKLTKKTKCMLQ
jgi:hypothetical protein